MGNLGEPTAHGAQIQKIKETYAEFVRLSTSDARSAVGLPTTDTEFSQRFGVSRMSLHKWKNDPDFKKMVAEPVLNFFTVQDLTGALLALKEQALSGNVPAIKQMLAMSGITGELKSTEDFDEKSMIELEQMSTEELERLVKGTDVHVEPDE